MTKPIQTKIHSHPGANRIPERRQPPSVKSPDTAKKAPAPPPNPAFANSQLSSAAKAAIVQPPQATNQNQPRQHPASLDVNPLQTPSTTEKNYDKYSDGALTYFNYYFEDIAAPLAPADYPQSANRSRIPVGMVGVGLAAATVTTGFLVTDALKPPESPQSKRPQDAADKQDTSAQSPRPTTIAPEKLETGRSLSSSPSWSTTNKPSPAKPSTPSLKQKQSTGSSFLTRGPLVSSRPPLKLQPLSISAAPMTLATSSVPLNRPEATSSSPQRSLAAEMVARASTLPAVAPPEALPQVGSPSVSSAPVGTANGAGMVVPTATPAPSQALSQSLAPLSSPSTQLTQASLSPTGTPTPGATTSTPTTPFPPGAVPSIGVSDPQTQSQAAYTSPASNSTADAGNSLVNPSGANPLASGSSPFSRQGVAQPITAPGDRLLETTPNGFNRLSLTPSTPNSSGGPSETIQNYLNRPQKPVNPAQALMPLSSKAAEEAATKPQIGVFTVRQVNQQDYQKEWLTSNRNPSDPAIASAFPAYGFIDYQRQVIVVLKEQPSTIPLQSKAPMLPSS